MNKQTEEAADATPPGTAGVRLDLWLLAARFAKTRATAKTDIAAGRVSINGQTAKAARLVRVGDRVGAVRGGERHELEVLALNTRRGPASVAQTLYAETQESRQLREQRRQEQREHAQFTAPPSRPDKRARRSLLDLLSGN